MTVIEDVHEVHGGSFRDLGSRRVVDDYGRPERTHAAVRRVVGVIEMGYGVVTITGADRRAFVDDAVSNRVPDAEGQGVYALLLDPDGHVETDVYVYDAGDRLLLFTPPERAAPLAEDWRGKTFIQDVTIEETTDDVAVFGVHGPKATEKVAGVLNGAGTPAARLSFVRGTMVDAGVTVIRSDGLVGEEGYEVVCDAAVAEDVFDTLENRGLNAAPFGYRAWETLTLEAGTPLFDSEIEGRLPNVLGMPDAVDYEKGCFVGQEVVSRIRNRGRPPERLVGLRPEAVPEGGDAVVVAGEGASGEDGEAVGEVTRAAGSPTLEEPIALAVVDEAVAAGDDPLAVLVDGETVPAERATLPFVEGSDDSARCPVAPGEGDEPAA